MTVILCRQGYALFCKAYDTQMIVAGEAQLKANPKERAAMQAVAQAHSNMDAWWAYRAHMATCKTCTDAWRKSAERET